MATTDFLSVVCDAGPLIHLDELDCLDLLRNLGKILIPEIVWKIGILVRSIRMATRTRQQILELLQDIPQRSSLHISRRLLKAVIAEVENPGTP